MPADLSEVIRQIARDLAAARSASIAVSPPGSPLAEIRGATALFIERAEIQMPAYVRVSGSRIVLEQVRVNKAFARTDKLGRVSMTFVPTSED